MLFVLPLALAALAGCQDDPSPVSPEIERPTLQQSMASDSVDSQIRPDEARQRGLSRRFGGFGGYFFDENGNVVVYLLNPEDPAAMGAARSAVMPILNGRRYGGHEVRPANPEIIIRQGEYTFHQLRAWRDRASLPVLTVGAIMVDLDESQNRIAVGIDPANPEARSVVLAKLDELKVPREAVVFKDFGLVRVYGTSGCNEPVYNGSCIPTGDYSINAADSLVNEIRPLVGGIYTQRVTRLANGQLEGSQCTLGVTTQVENG